MALANTVHETLWLRTLIAKISNNILIATSIIYADNRGAIELAHEMKGLHILNNDDVQNAFNIFDKIQAVNATPIKTFHILKKKSLNAVINVLQVTI